MQIAIIAEYNPFHNGHRQMLAAVRRAFGADACLSVILGGIFSQRGEPYITTPYVRAAAALQGGVDLVVELPFPYSCAPANSFARAGAEIAEALGADVLAFGSTADIAALRAAQTRVDDPAFQAEIAARCARFPELGSLRLTEALYAERFGESFPAHPNDRLAMAYLRALAGKKIQPFAVPRTPCASASDIRCGKAALAGNVPAEAERLYESAKAAGLFGADREALAGATLLALLQKTPESGAAERLCKAAATAKSIRELLETAATKAYTNAELSRAATLALCGVTDAALAEKVGYTRLFAANVRGCAALRSAKLPVLTKPADFTKLPEAARAQFARQALPERAFALCFSGAYNYLTATPEIRKE